MFLGNEDIPDPPDDGKPAFLVRTPEGALVWITPTECNGE